MAVWEALWACFPLRMAEIIKTQFKVSGNVLKDIQQMKKHLLKKNLIFSKNSKSQSHLNHNHALSPSSKLREMKTPLQTDTAKNIGLSLRLELPGRALSSQEGQDASNYPRGRIWMTEFNLWLPDKSYSQSFFVRLVWLRDSTRPALLRPFFSLNFLVPNKVT